MSNKILRIILVLVFSFVLLSLTLWLPDVARAGTITVDDFTDRLDFGKGNGLCSLREAIENANNNDASQVDCAMGSGMDTITLLYSGTYTLTLTGSLAGEETNLYGDLDITDDVIINGDHLKTTYIQAGSANPATGACKDCIDRVFDIDDSIVEISGVTIRFGQSHDGGSGGPVIQGHNGGGIRNIGGNLKLINCTVSFNKAGNGEPGSSTDGGSGGGIHSTGPLELINTTVWGNRAGFGASAEGYPGVDGGNGGGGGGIYIYSGGIFTATNVRIAENDAGRGGIGGANTDADAGDGGYGGDGGGLASFVPSRITDSRLYNNNAGSGGSGGNADGSSGNGGDGGNGGKGGGIYVNNPGENLILLDTTIRDNKSGSPEIEGSSENGLSGSAGFRGNGGGIYCKNGVCSLEGVTLSGNYALAGGGVYNTSTLTGINSTISGNNAYNNGGGINQGGSSSTTELYFVTITDNTADWDNDESGDGGGVVNSTVNLFEITKTILAGNNDDSSDDEYSDCRGDINSAGYNLFGDTSGSQCTFFSLGTDLVGSSYTPGVDVLADYGGSTKTHALLMGISDAIDHIPHGTSGCGTNYLYDQRGFPRNSDCDIGAFELPVFIFLPLIMR